MRNDSQSKTVKNVDLDDTNTTEDLVDTDTVKVIQILQLKNKRYITRYFENLC